MGMLDSVLGQVLGGAAAQQPSQGGAGLGDLGGLAGALGTLLANNGGQGGLGGLVSKFEQAGMGDVVGSWIGTGENRPVSGEQVQDALGGDTIANIASRLGINAQSLLPMLATLLPVLIDRLTPNGRLPEQGVDNPNDLLGTLGAMLQNRQP